MTLINWFFFTIMLFLNSIEFLSLYLASQPQLMKFESILSESRALWKPKNFRRGFGPIRPSLEGLRAPPRTPPAPFGLPTLACCSLRSLFRRFFLHLESCLNDTSFEIIQTPPPPARSSQSLQPRRMHEMINSLSVMPFCTFLTTQNIVYCMVLFLGILLVHFWYIFFASFRRK